LPEVIKNGTRQQEIQVIASTSEVKRSQGQKEGKKKKVDFFFTESPLAVSIGTGVG